jgi:hypothetical protein
MGTARENAETADLTLEVERLRGELEQFKRDAGHVIGANHRSHDRDIERLAASESKVQSLTEQLAEATGLLERWVATARIEGEAHGSLYEATVAVVSRAPAQAAEPSPPRLSDNERAWWAEKQAIWDADKARAESAESKLAAVVKVVASVREHRNALRVDQDYEWQQAGATGFSAIETLLAPSQGEGGGE